MSKKRLLRPLRGLAMTTAFCLFTYFLGFAQPSSRKEYFRQRMDNLKKIKQGQQGPQSAAKTTFSAYDFKKKLLAANKELEGLVKEYQNIAFVYKESAEREQRLSQMKEKIRLLLKKEAQAGNISDSQQEIILQELIRPAAASLKKD